MLNQIGRLPLPQTRARSPSLAFLADRRHRPAAAAEGPPASTAQDMSDTLSLQNIRSSLIRQEDTIIFSLIERAQFARNELVYTSTDAIEVPGERM